MPTAKGIDKTIIIEDSLPYGSDTMETQVHPDMDGLAEQFDHEDVVPPSPPKGPIATRLRFTEIC